MATMRYSAYSFYHNYFILSYLKNSSHKVIYIFFFFCHIFTFSILYFISHITYLISHFSYFISHVLYFIFLHSIF